MMKKGAVLVALLVLLQQAGICQPPRYDEKYADSLQAILSRQTNNADAYATSSLLVQYYYEKGLLAQAIQHTGKNLQLATALNNKNFIAKSLHRKAHLFTNTTQYDSGFYYASAAQKLATKIKDTAVLANCYSTFAILSNYHSDYSSATAYLMQAADLLEKTTTKELQQQLPPVYISIGYNLFNENQLQKGIDYTKKGLTYTGYTGENRYRTMANLTVCESYLKLKQPDSAKIYLDAAIAVNSRIDNIIVHSMVASISGLYYNATGNKQKALDAYLLSYKLCDSTKNDFLKAEAAGFVAQLYLELNNFIQAGLFIALSIL